MKTKDIILLVLEPGCPPVKKRVPNTPMGLKETVHGLNLGIISIVEGKYEAIINLDAIRKCYPENLYIDGSFLFGTVVITKLEHDGFVSLTETDMQMLNALYAACWRPMGRRQND